MAGWTLPTWRQSTACRPAGALLGGELACVTQAFTPAGGVYGKILALLEPRLLHAHPSSLCLLLLGSTATWVSSRSQRPAACAVGPCSSLFS